MPILMPKAPVAHTLPVLSAMFSIVAALSRFELGVFFSRACSCTKVLTRHCSGSASPPTEFKRCAVHGTLLAGESPVARYSQSRRQGEGQVRRREAECFGPPIRCPVVWEGEVVRSFPIPI